MSQFSHLTESQNFYSLESQPKLKHIFALKKYSSGKTTLESGAAQLWLRILSNDKLLIFHGNQMIQSLLLTNGQDWIEVIPKGNAMLFLCKPNNEVALRFCIQFSDWQGKTSNENSAL